MVNEKMRQLGANRSVIRELFEYANRRRGEIGAENVFDFTLGNPATPPPNAVKGILLDIIENTPEIALHGYTSAQGDKGVRAAIANYIKNDFDFPADPELIYLTVGAAAALTSSLNAILTNDDEVIVPSPFFPEYKVFTEKAGGRLVPVASLPETFKPDIGAIINAVTERTKAVIINSPNNPTGVVYSESDIISLTSALEERSLELGRPIYLISDEPYRELTYGSTSVPYIPKYYKNTIVCYSFSKSLSLPGERIGYVLVSPEADESLSVYEAICGAARALGFVCAPSLFQYLIPPMLGKCSDISVYARNREKLLSVLQECGFYTVPPDGAFYLFIKAPNGNTEEFCENARKFELLFVPAESFGAPGYVRLAYCVSESTVDNSIPAFLKLKELYKQ